MADRFPSLEEFDSGAPTETRGDAFDAASPAGDDFLSRERAALGEDAGQFASSEGAALVDSGDNDLLGGGDDIQQEAATFESSFPVIEESRTEAASPAVAVTSTYPSSYRPPSNEPEPDVIREWRENRDLALKERDEKSEQRKEETVKAAQQNIDDFYENYNSKKEKAIAQTRRDAEEFLNSRQDTSAGGTSWERIAKLVDLSGKGAKGGASGTGKQKFRELLLNLRKDESAPGASGV